MGNKAKNFLVSTADFAMYYNEALVCTGTTNLNTSIEVSMEEQEIKAGKGNKLIYTYKYGRALGVTLEAADWDLSYLALNLGRGIATGLDDMYKIAECVTVVGGIATLPTSPIGNVAVELSDGSIITVTPTGTTIDLTTYGITSGTVNVTYKFKNMAKTIVVDADTSPNVYKLVLDAEKHNNRLGKVGSVQIEVPSYQPSGNFNIDFTPDGVTSTNIDGKALAVDGDTCENGGAVYAYIREFDNTSSAITVSDIAAVPAVVALAPNETKEVSVIGLKGGAYSPVELNNTDCTFSTGSASVATVSSGGVITAVGDGTTNITVEYDGKKDIIEVTVATV